ncbi:MAG: hypothetical protein R3343_00025 [Nitriliruptorales bacterium]|nr:hypothetical protein [Nitriliruptorales bacterium]
MGHDVDEYLESFATYRDAGFAAITIHNVGPHQQEFIDWASNELLPAWDR